MIDLFGVGIHDPDVVFTDAGLAILGVWLAWKLRKHSTPAVLILGGLASAAFWGAIFHGFFPASTSTRDGYLVWLPVPLSIVVVAGTLLALSLRLLIPRLPDMALRLLVAAYAVSFVAVILMVDESFRIVVRFYAPTLILFLLAAVMQAWRSGATGWKLLAVSFVVSGLAAVLQQLRVGINPEYFDHNALYHVLQAVALVLMYLGFARVPVNGGGAQRA